MPEKVNFVDKVLSRIDRLDRTSVQSYVAGLVRERKRFEGILDQINEGILVLDREGTVKLANRRAFLWLGFERFLKDRSSILELIREQNIRRFVSECLRRPDESASEEFQVLTPREMALRLHWVPGSIEDENEILFRIENVTHDRTQSEEEAQNQRIESLIRLAAGVAHEIGNPLNSIQIHVGLLEREITKLPKPKQRDFRKSLEALSSETRRLDQIVRAFLRATRRPPLRFRKEALNEVLTAAVDFIRVEVERKKIKIRLELDKKLPEFLLDRDRLHQAFINLIKNAAEAMPHGGELRISSAFSERLCLIRFEDQGEGIADEDLPHIFEAYYTTKEQGSGLGLAQVYQTVREHGGRIDVKTRVGKGSVFTLALPIRTERLSLPQPEPSGKSR